MTFYGTSGTDARKNAHGVDINRNFGFKWGLGSSGAAETPENAFDYPGVGPFSEPETRAVRDYVLSNKITGFLDVHGYESVIHTPFFHSLNPPLHHAQHRAVAMWMAHAVSRTGGACMTYEIVEGAKATFRTGSGLSADWAYGEAGILHSYILEMAPSTRTQADVAALLQDCESQDGTCSFPWPACVQEIGCSNTTILDHAKDLHAFVQMGKCVAGTENCLSDLPPNSSRFVSLTLHICNAVNRTFNAIGKGCGDALKSSASWCVECRAIAAPLKAALQEELRGPPYHVGTHHANGPAADFEEYLTRCFWRLSGAGRMSKQDEASWSALHGTCTTLNSNDSNEPRQDNVTPPKSTSSSEPGPIVPVRESGDNASSAPKYSNNASNFDDVSLWAPASTAESRDTLLNHLPLIAVVLTVCDHAFFH